MLALGPLLCLAPHCAAAACQAEPVPFVALGQALLAAADERSGGPPELEGADRDVRFLRRIEPLHQRVRLGAVELWAPTLTVECDFTLGKAPPLAELAPLATATLALQRQWLEQAGLDGGDAARAKSAIARLETWARSLGGSKLAEWTSDLEADCDWLAACFRRDPGRAGAAGEARPGGIVVLLAPGRAQYLAVLGAAGLLDQQLREWFWHESGKRTAGTALYRSACLVPFAYGPARDDGRWCENHPLAPTDRLQATIHQVSHAIALDLVPTAPTWFAEGLALFDTIRATGGDETLCTGAREAVQTLLPLAAGNSARGPAGTLVWVTREASPYRDGSSPRFFLKELAAALEPKKGFAILDLDTGKVAQWERGPFLGSRAELPESIASARSGVKEGFAEFFRAYCAAFVTYLHETRLGDDRLLQLVLAELRTRTYGASRGAPEDLLDTLEQWTNHVLAPGSATTDTVERSFVDWIAKRR